jgi:hypothetical protein
VLGVDVGEDGHVRVEALAQAHRLVGPALEDAPIADRRPVI